MVDFLYEVKIPKERIAVLIGTDGETKDLLEKETSTNINIDSNEGDVFIKGEDALKLYSCREIVKAIARGFNPEIALRLLKQDYAFELIDISKYTSEKANHIMRIKGRIIGKDGKSRRTIEELTETSISVYGKTVGIIGGFESVIIAKRAIESLITGSPHSSVYKWLEKKRREIKRKEFDNQNVY